MVYFPFGCEYDPTDGLSITGSSDLALAGKAIRR
jgi:hypothetical protein